MKIIDANYRLVCDKLLINAADGNPSATLSKNDFLLHVFSNHGMLDDEITEAVFKQYDSMLAEYNSSEFGSTEPRDVIDSRAVYYHLKQQGRVVTDSFNAPGARVLKLSSEQARA